MKKQIILGLLLCAAWQVSAQVYIKGAAGYTWNNAVNGQWTVDERLNNARTLQAFIPEYGGGANLGLSIGYDFSRHFAVEISGNALVGSGFDYSFHLPEIDYTTVSYYAIYYNTHVGDFLFKTRLFRLSQQAVFYSGFYRQFRFYVKGGPDFMLAQIKVSGQQENISFNWDTQKRVTSPSPVDSKYTGKIQTGWQASFGAEYACFEKLSFFAEFSTFHTRYKFDQGHNLIEKTDYEVSDRVGFNNLGVNLGVKYHF